MADLTPTQFWIRRGGFLAIALILQIQALIPLDMTANRIPGPDILFGLTMAYVIRRPEYVPLWSIVLVFFLRDIISMAPLGIWTFIMVISTEIVRSNLQAFREYYFGIEWLWISILFAGALLALQLALFLSLSFTPKFVDQLYQFLFTAGLYPVIVGIMRYGFRIDRPAAGKTDGWGQRI